MYVEAAKSRIIKSVVENDNLRSESLGGFASMSASTQIPAHYSLLYRVKGSGGSFVVSNTFFFFFFFFFLLREERLEKREKKKTSEKKNHHEKLIIS